MCEPVIECRDGEVLVRIDDEPEWHKPVRLLYCEDPFRFVPPGAKVLFAAHPECREYAGKCLTQEERDEI
jgi:hypothetical protein